METTVERHMISKLADNIISPLGTTTEANFSAVLNGESRLLLQEDGFSLPEPFCASVFDRQEILDIFDQTFGKANNLTFFEKLCILSVQKAIDECGISPADKEVVFVLSTTKGNVHCLEESTEDNRCYLWESANKVGNWFGNNNAPIVVSNACVSGVCAQIAAVRELLSGTYRYAVVIGCDILSKFIVSGFQSFKALSQDKCKPYDSARCGLNLGEAVGTIILEAKTSPNGESWSYVSSSIHNDANHISGPSRTGEGLYRVLNDIVQEIDTDQLGFVNVHGTSTAYNDEMESIALSRAKLDQVPINGLKGYYGHTLGAAGIIETILSMKAIEKGVVLATKGFENIGTTHNVNISNQTRRTDKKMFIKILSGFGGSNAGIAYQKGGEL